MKVAILVPQGALGAEVFGLADILLIANRISATMGRCFPFQVSIVGVRHAPVILAGGLPLAVENPRQCDLLVVPAFDFSRPEDLSETLSGLAPEIEFLRKLGREHPIASICAGAFLLGEAGLLAARTCTTAWAFAADLARRYPTARVDDEALMVQDGALTTYGAFSACYDLAFDLIRMEASNELARAVGKVTLLNTMRESQSPYVDPRLIAGSIPIFAKSVIDWMEMRLREPYSLSRLAAAFNVSERTLLRRFKAETGRSPLKHLQDLRLVRASQLLESTRLTTAEVAHQIGYLDLSTFSRLFSHKMKMTPAAYRREFVRAKHYL